MKIVSNPKKIQRNYKIGLYTSLGSLVLLFAAVGMTILPLFGNNQPELVSYSFLAMLLGLILSQVGVYFANRWGKSPRIDERITTGLKGLDDRYTLYHYTAPVPHLLAGPAGLWVLVPQYQGGAITYENGRFRQKGVGVFGRLIGQEGLGRPEAEAEAYRRDMENFIKKSLPEDCQPGVKSAIVFTSPKASVQVQDSPLPAMPVDKLKDFVRRMAKEEPANMKEVGKVFEMLPAEDVS